MTRVCLDLGMQSFWMVHTISTSIIEMEHEYEYYYGTSWLS